MVRRVRSLFTNDQVARFAVIFLVVVIGSAVAYVMVKTLAVPKEAVGLTTVVAGMGWWLSSRARRKRAEDAEKGGGA